MGSKHRGRGGAFFGHKRVYSRGQMRPGGAARGATQEFEEKLAAQPSHLEKSEAASRLRDCPATGGRPNTLTCKFYKDISGYY